MDSDTAVQVGTALQADSPDWSTPACCSGSEDDMPEGGVIACERVLADPWSQTSARRAMGFLAVRKTGPRLWAMRIDPFPIGGRGRTMQWLCFARQHEIDAWRASDPHADATLTAVIRWLRGPSLPFGTALAASFQLGAIQTALFDCLDAREMDVLQRRMEGETLVSIAVSFALTRERIRQIESEAAQRIGGRITSLLAVQHPVTAALFAHLNHLAARVLDAASRKECILRDDRRRRWIRHTLTASEAGILQIIMWIGEGAQPRHKPLFDPLSFAGAPLQGGRTSLPWRDWHVAAIREAFGLAAGDRHLRCAGIDGVCASAGLTRESVTTLARFADLTHHGNWLLEGPPKMAGLRRAWLAETLSAAGRAMTEAEILEELVPLGFGSDSALRDIHMAMSEDSQTFVSDGNASWQLRSTLGRVVNARRAAHPVLFPPASHQALADALAGLHLPGKGIAVLEGVDIGSARFAFDAGERLAGALDGLPGDERRSLGQILRPADEAKLTAWLGQAAPGGAGDRAREGLTLLAAFVAVVRASAGSDDGFWPNIMAACGEDTSRWLFGPEKSPRRRMFSRLVEVATVHRLRRAFSFQADPWASMLTMQAGLLRKDIGSMRRWLQINHPSIAIRQIVAPGQNHSASMACTWGALYAYRRGQIGREAIETLARQSEWWPGWSVDEACLAIAEPTAASEPIGYVGEGSLPHPGMPVAA